MKEEILPGDYIVITQAGPNNSSAPEYNSSLTIKFQANEKPRKVKEVKKGGRYDSSSGSHTLILETGQPIWSNSCKKVSGEIINNYSIY